MAVEAVAEEPEEKNAENLNIEQISYLQLDLKLEIHLQVQMEIYQVRLEEQEERINREIDLLVALKEQIREVIGQVDDDRLQMVLVYRYLEGKTFEKIGEELYAAKSTIVRWHRKAIDQIRLPEDAIIARFRA